MTKLNKYIVIHKHRYGITTYQFKCKELLPIETNSESILRMYKRKIAEQLEIEYEPLEDLDIIEIQEKLPILKF